MGHHKCQEEICGLKNRLEEAREEKERVQKAFEGLRSEMMKREKEMQEKLQMANSAKTACVKEKDKTVENLIHLIEQDTHELLV